ncbi:MAG: hypothetical protein ACI9CF_001312 [Candidatus Omnitrophota bacterium]|jgi:hypothetical protein
MIMRLLDEMTKKPGSSPGTIADVGERKNGKYSTYSRRLGIRQN